MMDQDMETKPLNTLKNNFIYYDFVIEFSIKFPLIFFYNKNLNFIKIRKRNILKNIRFSKNLYIQL